MLVVFVSGCVTSNTAPRPNKPEVVRIEILNLIPKDVEGFVYKGAKAYPDPWGYSMRYQLKRNRLVYSDVYVYPVPNTAAGIGSDAIAKRMAELALSEIDLAKEKGFYSEYEIIESREFDLKGRPVSRSDLYLVKNNLESFSLLFLTESRGMLIKARMTMPDNEANRNSETWQRFVEEVFGVIIENIDKA